MSPFIEAAAGWLVRLADALLDLHDRAREAAAAELARAAGEAAHALVEDALRPSRPRQGGPQTITDDRGPDEVNGPPAPAATPWRFVGEVGRWIARRLAGPPAARWVGLGTAVAGLAGLAGLPGGRAF